MSNILILLIFSLTVITSLVVIGCILFQNNKIQRLYKMLNHQYNLIVKMQSVLKSKSATNTVAENAEMIYQDLLQNLIPVMAAIDIMPRTTTEHPLWRALGGIMDEYAKNPFVLEKLRRSIKLNPDIMRSVDNYVNRANGFLQYLTNNEQDGILSTTFTNGLLGQSLTFFAQAKQLAFQDN